MQRLFFILVCLSVLIGTGTVLSAQSARKSKIDLKSYTGTWKYESDNVMVILKIRDTIRFSTAGNRTISCLVGTYRYVRNDSIIIDNMDMYWNNGNPMEMPVYSSLGSEDAIGNILSLYVFFEDTKTGKTSNRCRINYALGRRAPELTWHLIDEGDTIIWDAFGSDDPEYNEVMRKKKLPGWSVPNDITFVKVE